MTLPLSSNNPPASLAELRAAAADCRACPLWENATQTVFSSGPAGAAVMLVGEQPGDQEDRQGKPFVGPAGQLLRDALGKAELNPTQIYFTNVVKHFKWEPRGQRRLHKSPLQSEIKVCSDWLRAEIDLLQPTVIVCLGATAAKAVIDKKFKITQERGRFVDSDSAPFVFATVHPSYLLRLPDPALKEEQYRLFVDDLRLIHQALISTATPSD